MSRIGKLPVQIVSGVKVNVAGNKVNVEGPKGKLQFEFLPEVGVEVKGNEVLVTNLTGTREAKALHGLTRAVVANMIEGVTKGYEKKLELQGVGYVCSLKGQILSLRVGYANEVKKDVPAGLKVECPDQTHINISGCDKQLVGQFAAAVRSVRKPEPYKGKGIRYVGEQIKLKPGKAASK
ncbi:MAG: 50S ribosomal protein L6 [Planctomycetota bacterium]|jgi:large subunit ribosomal protein L6|nr:50S ribosomal protein L6 [Blastopirellula sp.]